MALDSPCRRTPSTMPSSVHSMPGSLQDSVDERRSSGAAARSFYPSHLWGRDERRSLLLYPSPLWVETSEARSGVARSAGWGLSSGGGSPPPDTSLAALTMRHPPHKGEGKTPSSALSMPPRFVGSRRAKLVWRCEARSLFSLPLLWGGWREAPGGGLFPRGRDKKTPPHPACAAFATVERQSLALAQISASSHPVE
jgi:hypothetical protein